MIEANYLILVLKYFIMILKKIHLCLGEVMFKFLIMGILAGTLSNLTGIPLFPVTPIIHENHLYFAPAQIDEKKLDNFNRYIKSLFS
jgi:hypothetical protein